MFAPKPDPVVVATEKTSAAIRAAIAYRPQEQPRKATGEMVEAAVRVWMASPDDGTLVSDMEAAVNAALAASVSPAAAQGWQPIETAPKDGTPVAGQELYRYLPYKPEGRKQMHADGRWQRHNGYGWENASLPTHWMPLGDGAAVPPSPAAQEQEK